MRKQKIAGIVSVVSDPLVEGPILLSILFFIKSTVPLWLLPVIILINILLPAIFMAYSLKQGLITDWETTRRNERHGFNLVCLLASLMTLFLLYQFGDAFLMRLFLIFVFLILTYSLITLFWKISGHMTANTAFVLVLNVLFDWRFCWLVFLLPLVAWARMVRNKHDIWQILGGVALSSLVILLGNYALF